MAFFNEPILNIRNRLTDWLNVSTQGGNVPNLDLDLINRAQQWLQAYRQWDSLVAIVTLSVGDNTIGTTVWPKSSILPTDLKSILSIYVDNVVVGKPQIYFYEECPDVAFRYTKNYIYDPASGGYWIVSWPSVSPLLSAPKLRYIKILDDFTGVDTDGQPITEYSFFPPNLILRCAQKIHIEEKGITGDNVQPALNSFQEELKMYESMSQFNNSQPDLTPKNKFGQPIKLYGHQLNGRQLRNGYTPYTPAQQAGFHGY
jgi:hypothetical protein